MPLPTLEGKRKLVGSLGLGGLVAALPVGGPYGELVKLGVIGVIAVAHQFAQAKVDAAKVAARPRWSMEDVRREEKSTKGSKKT